MFEGGWLSDNAGRIENISLAPNVKNAVYPLFEAVMNSIHAIEERFGPDGLAQGRIEITLQGDEQGEGTQPCVLQASWNGLSGIFHWKQRGWQTGKVGI